MTADTTTDHIKHLIGDDNTPGILDDYTITTVDLNDNGKPVIVWRCDNGCGNGAGHVGIIARNLNFDQAGLTLGELVAAALRHRAEDHRA